MFAGRISSVLFHEVRGAFQQSKIGHNKYLLCAYSKGRTKLCERGCSLFHVGLPTLGSKDDAPSKNIIFMDVFQTSMT